MSFDERFKNTHELTRSSRREIYQPAVIYEIIVKPTTVVSEEDDVDKKSSEKEYNGGYRNN